MGVKYHSLSTDDKMSYHDKQEHPANRVHPKLEEVDFDGWTLNCCGRPEKFEQRMFTRFAKGREQ